ncbi:MAG: hypothetical protein ACFFCP_14360, partial [Promethearchaeota archaeon]
SGVWYSWAFLLSPIVGILLGPYLGAVSVGIGSLVGHTIYYRESTEFLFMVGLSVGAAMAGFVYQRRWKPVFGIYTAMLLGYFIYPVSWRLPLWGIWDTLVGYGIVLIYSGVTTRKIWSNTNERYKILLLLFCTVIALESDILFRVFVLLPGQVHWVLGMTPEILYDVWLVAGIITPIKVILASIVVVTIGLQIIRILERHGDSVGLHNENTLPSNVINSA